MFLGCFALADFVSHAANGLLNFHHPHQVLGIIDALSKHRTFRKDDAQFVVQTVSKLKNAGNIQVCFRLLFRPCGFHECNVHEIYTMEMLSLIPLTPVTKSEQA